ncbi:MAG: M1 family aminopeptidase [Flavobacteriales bacterium]|jgi:aminopeptidase N|nr:M1 family aminopeptidase [Flavobacteriales bacterium]
MKNGLLLLAILLIQFSSIAQLQCSHKNHKHHLVKSSTTDNLRSDTIDILHYSVDLAITNFSNQAISGACTIDFVALQNNINSLSLDLLRLTVDSIQQHNQNLSFNYNDSLILVQLNNVLNQNDTSQLTVFYHGSPQGDPSGWGGWYFSGNYAYNLGVGFQDNPHNYGRVWHPCFDNFVERATYTFTIKTDTSKSVHCSGLLTNEAINSSIKTTTFEMNQAIPTYLAGIAVGNYTHIYQNYSSQLSNTTIPIMLSAQANDTTNLKNSFVNLNQAMAAFENGYGPYFWDKVGYSLVPFNAGAMEHATNIAYPIYAANGNLANETLMAHELSHHWWGNLVTCRTAEDMWINEGMAAYSERLFLEHVYGYDSYISSIRENHKEVLHHAHINDDGFRAIHGVPHEYTYGDHSYNKGADVAHTLRSYMGDSIFFATLTAFLDANKFKDVDAYDLRDFINTHSTINVTDFFNDWVFNPGFPHFSIDSIETTYNGTNYDNTVYVKQKLRAAPHLYQNVPLEITFKNHNWAEESFSFLMNGAQNTFQFTTSFVPTLSFLNGKDQISQAVTSETQTLSSTGVKDFSHAFFRTTIQNISDSAYIKVEHNWVAPDHFKDGSQGFIYDISTERYWNITGILPSTFDATIRLQYNGRNNNSGNLDNLLTSSAGFNEDSLVLFYRPNTKEDWQVMTNCTFNSQGSKTDGYGRVDIHEFKLGQYTFGWKRGAVDIKEQTNAGNHFDVFPSLATNIVSLKASPTINSYAVVDLLGKVIVKKDLFEVATLHVENWPKGVYLIIFYNDNEAVGKKEFIKQ